MPAQLYHDLQATFLDALFCCAKSKQYCPSEPIYLVLSGTDPEERWFGNVRLTFRGSNCTALDMVNTTRSTDNILSVDHPEWTTGNRVQRHLQLDYSNPAAWEKEKLVLENVNIKATWKSGFYQALGMLPVNVNDADDFENVTTTLRCPLKRVTVVVVGVKVAANEVEEGDWSIPEDDDNDEDVEEVVVGVNVAANEVEEGDSSIPEDDDNDEDVEEVEPNSNDSDDAIGGTMYFE